MEETSNRGKCKYKSANEVQNGIRVLSLGLVSSVPVALFTLKL